MIINYLLPIILFCLFLLPTRIPQKWRFIATLKYLSHHFRGSLLLVPNFDSPDQSLPFARYLPRKRHMRATQLWGCWPPSSSLPVNDLPLSSAFGIAECEMWCFTGPAFCKVATLFGRWICWVLPFLCAQLVSMPAMNSVIMTSHEMHGKQHYFLGYLKFERELRATQPWTLRRRQSAEDAPKRWCAGIGGNWTVLPRVTCVSHLLCSQLLLCWIRSSDMFFFAPNSFSTMCWISSFRRAISGDHSSVRTTVSFLQWLESPQFGSSVIRIYYVDANMLGVGESVESKYD